MTEESFEQQQVRLLHEEEQTRNEMEFIQQPRALNDYRYDKEQDQFWDIVTGKLFKAASVDASIPKTDWPTKQVRGKEGSVRLVYTKPSEIIRQFENGLFISGSTWSPGEEEFIKHQVMTERGPMEELGAIVYNTYFPPKRRPSKRGVSADKWVEHVKKLFPSEGEHNHFFDYAAHMLQRPEEKANHGIVISGGQGIGKDTMLLPLRVGVGLWNVAEVSPDSMEDRFNPFVRCVMLVVNEVRPHNEYHRASGFYNRMKPYFAAPPELLPMEMKQCHIVYVRNVMRVFMTTNDYQTMYVPDEDRRMFIMHSFLAPQWAGNDYFIDMFDYFRNGGIEAVVDWLLRRDISKFLPGAPPPMTAGKQQVLSSTKMIRRSVINDAFEAMVGDGPEPEVFFLSDLKRSGLNGQPSFDDDEELTAAFKHPSLIHKLHEIGYEACKPPEAKRWKWKKNGAGADGKPVEFKADFACVKRNLAADDRFDRITEEGKKRLKAKTSSEF